MGETKITQKCEDMGSRELMSGHYSMTPASEILHSGGQKYLVLHRHGWLLWDGCRSANSFHKCLDFELLFPRTDLPAEVCSSVTLVFAKHSSSVSFKGSWFLLAYQRGKGSIVNSEELREFLGFWRTFTCPETVPLKIFSMVDCSEVCAPVMV